MYMNVHICSCHDVECYYITRDSITLAVTHRITKPHLGREHTYVYCNALDLYTCNKTLHRLNGLNFYETSIWPLLHATALTLAAIVNFNRERESERGINESAILELRRRMVGGKLFRDCDWMTIGVYISVICL